MAVGRCGRDCWRAAPIARDCPNCQSYQDLMKGAGRADAPAAHVSSGDIFHEHFRLAPLVTDGVRLAGQVGSGSDLMKLADFRSWQILLQKSPPGEGRSAVEGFEDGHELCLAACSVGSSRLGATPTRPDAYPTHTVAMGGGCAASLASLRRFWAIAASVNSSCAPRGPRSRRRPSFRMRFKWANSISTRL